MRNVTRTTEEALGSFSSPLFEEVRDALGLRVRKQAFEERTPLHHQISGSGFIRPPAVIQTCQN